MRFVLSNNRWVLFRLGLRGLRTTVLSAAARRVVPRVQIDRPPAEEQPSYLRERLSGEWQLNVIPSSTMSDGQMFQCTNRFRPPPLDQTSRQTLGYFALKLGVIFAFATIGAIFDNHPMLRFCSVVQPLAFLIGITAIAVAYLSGEAPRGRMSQSMGQGVRRHRARG